MKVFTLLEFESYYKTVEKRLKVKERLLSKTSTAKREEALENTTQYIIAISKDNNRKLRILHILKMYSSTETFTIIDYNIIGNYEDIVLRIETKDIEPLFIG